jgi:aspartate/methionine/tyrosine aminotransferase
MTEFHRPDDPAAAALQATLTARHAAYRRRGLALDLTRGKPCPEQLDLSLEMLTCVDERGFRAADGTDCRNYGGLDGLPEAKRLFADLMGVEVEEIVIGGNASLSLMYDTLLRAMVKGVGPDLPPWGRLPRVRFLCPSPGYDRHFSICEHLGMELIPVSMDDRGPDMAQVERLAAEDEAIKGIWCVPRYSNPTGVVYDPDVVARLAAMPTRAADFRIFWDDAYAVHHLVDTPPPLPDILEACRLAGHPDRVLLFASTSKITFPGSGVALMAGSRRNMDFVRREMFFQTIGPDKLNQLRHVRFLKDREGIAAHMRRHAAILKPKFAAVQATLARELEGAGIARWSCPQGGYFISFDTLPGCARRVVQLAGEAGVKLTPAGATFPLGRDPEDRNIRIAPTFAPLADIGPAMEILAVSTQLAALEQRTR